jgi:hypothetical protein
VTRIFMGVRGGAAVKLLSGEMGSVLLPD